MSDKAYHAELAPSSAKRWINCPASVGLSRGIPDTAGVDAAKGTLAHSIAELKARKRFLPLNRSTYSSQMKKLKASELYEADMDGRTDTYLEVLEQHFMSFDSAPFCALESAVPIGQWTGEIKENGSPATGTADCIQIGGGVLWVTDYKNGSGVPVAAEENPQMMLYALGALSLYRPAYGDSIKTVKMTIVQPAAGGVSDWEISRDKLLSWGEETVKPAALKAKSADPGVPCPGDWCRFCPCANLCRARAYEYEALAVFRRQPPELMDTAEIGRLLTVGAGVVSWYNALKDYALQNCLRGESVPGWKVVAGRSSRVWDDTDSALEDIAAKGVQPELLWERAPVTVAKLEKAIGKKLFADVAESHVVKKPGSPSLAPENDSRPMFNAAAQAFEAATV